MIITNNKRVYNKYREVYNIMLINGDFREVLVKTRDKIHEGYELLTHPLSSSVKPNETPYKSIIISDKKGNINLDSLYIIENSIMSYDNFNKNKMNFITDEIMEDFSLIDLTVLESALNI